MKAGGAELLLIVEVIEPRPVRQSTTPKIERAFSLNFGCGGGGFRVAAARGSPPPPVIECSCSISGVAMLVAARGSPPPLKSSICAQFREWWASPLLLPLPPSKSSTDTRFWGLWWSSSCCRHYYHLQNRASMLDWNGRCAVASCDDQ